MAQRIQATAMRVTERYLHILLQVRTVKLFTSRPAEPLVQVAYQGIEACHSEPRRIEVGSRLSAIAIKGKSDIPIERSPSVSAYDSAKSPTSSCSRPKDS